MRTLLPGFRFESLLGRGGMGAVYRAVQISLNRPVAVKILPVDRTDPDDANWTERFRREARTLARLNHPGIVGIHEHGEVEGYHYLVMELVDGTDLARVIQSEGAFAPDRVVELLTQVCDALEYAHRRGVVHRDLKPANLLITREGRVKIADFGLAKHDDMGLALTHTNLAIGTPDFVAPEAWLPGTPVDARADLYSLGVTLYQMLTGEVPRGLWKMPSVTRGLDPRFDAIIDRAMQPDRDRRYQTTTEFKTALQRIVQEPGTEAAISNRTLDREGSLRKQRVSSDRRTVFATLAGLIVVALAAWAFVHWLPQPGPPVVAGLGDPSVGVPQPTVGNAARWLLQHQAVIEIQHEGRQFTITNATELPDGPFEIRGLLWRIRPEHQARVPPIEQFAVLNAVKTFRAVQVWVPELNDHAFAFLAGNTNLALLTIDWSPAITDDLFDQLAGMNRLEELALARGRNLTGSKIPGAPWLSSIRSADFSGTWIGEEAIRTLADCPQLRQLMLFQTPISRSGLEALTNTPTLIDIDLSYCPGLNEQDLVDLLPSFRQLQVLQLSYSLFGDRAARVVGGLTNLTLLRVAGTRLTDAGLEHFENLTHLRSLSLVNTEVTAAGVARFAKARPRCEVEWRPASP